MQPEYDFTKDSLSKLSLKELQALAKKYDVYSQGVNKKDLAQSIYNHTIGAQITSQVILKGTWS